MVGAQGCTRRGGACLLLDLLARTVDRHRHTIAGLVFGGEAVQAQVFGALHGLLGDSGTQAFDAMLKGANRPREGILATVIGVGTLVFAAVGVVVQLKDALNTVWEVETPPGSGIWRFVRTYIWSLAGVLSVGFLLLTTGSTLRGERDRMAISICNHPPTSAAANRAHIGATTRTAVTGRAAADFYAIRNGDGLGHGYFRPGGHLGSHASDCHSSASGAA
jgi:hypothetical protein